MTWLDEIGTRLQDQGIGSVGTDVFLGYTPSSPDALVAVLPTAGLESVRAMGVDDLVLRPSFQAMARAKKSGDAETKIASVRAALHGFAGTLAGGGGSARYLEVKALQSEGFPLPQDEGKRFRWVCNFQVHKEPSA